MAVSALLLPEPTDSPPVINIPYLLQADRIQSLERSLRLAVDLEEVHTEDTLPVFPAGMAVQAAALADITTMQGLFTVVWELPDRAIGEEILRLLTIPEVEEELEEQE
jgi:hypothetical protein